MVRIVVLLFRFKKKTKYIFFYVVGQANSKNICLLKLVTTINAIHRFVLYLLITKVALQLFVNVILNPFVGLEGKQNMAEDQSRLQ